MSETPQRRGTGLSKLRLSDQERAASSSSKRQVILVALAVVALLGGAVVLGVVVSSAGDERENAPASSPTPTKARRGASASSSSQVAAGGYVEARRSAILLPGRDGSIATVSVTLGQIVEEGQLLLELESRAEEAELDMAQAELDMATARVRRVRSGNRVEEVEAAGAEVEVAEASSEEMRRNLERLEQLLPQGATAASEVERARQRSLAAQARVRALSAKARLMRRGSLPVDVLAAQAEQARAEAAIRRAQARLELARLRAPYAGTIVGVNMEPGEVVSLQSGQGGIELADLSELWVRVDIPEARIRRVRQGAQASVVIDALGEEPLSATVVEIAPQADRQSNTVEVAVRINDAPALLRPNMSARVAIDASQEER